MLTVIDVCTKTGKRALLILWLVTRFGALDEYFFRLAGIWIFPHISRTDTRLHLIYVLSACTRRTERIPFDFSLVDTDFKRVSLWQYGNSGGTCLHTSVWLCDRHTLHTVNSRFVFQYSIDIIAADSKVYFLKSSYCAFTDICDTERPTLWLTESLIHLEQVACKKTRFVASCSSSYFHLHILCILRVLRNESYLYILFQIRL